MLCWLESIGKKAAAWPPLDAAAGASIDEDGEPAAQQDFFAVTCVTSARLNCGRCSGKLMTCRFR